LDPALNTHMNWHQDILLSMDFIKVRLLFQFNKMFIIFIKINYIFLFLK